MYNYDKAKALLTAGFLLLVNFKSFSQTKELTLSEGWEAAFAEYPGLSEKHALIKESEYQKREVQNGLLPKVQLQLQNTYGTFAGSTGGFFFLPGTFNVSGTNSTSEHSASTTGTFGSVSSTGAFLSLDDKEKPFRRRKRIFKKQKVRSKLPDFRYGPR